MKNRKSSTNIVTSFIKDDDKVLILKRSNKVKWMKCLWAGVSGIIEKYDVTPLARAKSEIFEDPYNIAKYWIKGQKELKPEGGNVAFLKTHTPLVTINNNSFTNESLSLAIIHVVRDPRDIVVSYSKFMNEN